VNLALVQFEFLISANKLLMQELNQFIGIPLLTLGLLENFGS